MKNMPRNPGRKRWGCAGNPRAGFTLMEVALAILVMAIGVIATFALVVSGLDSNMKASADTRAAIFADNVFNALHARSLSAAAESDATGDEWKQFWEDFKKGTEVVSLSAESAWKGPSGNWAGADFWINDQMPVPRWKTDTETDKGIRAWNQSGIFHRRIQFKNAPFPNHPRGLDQLANHVIRYQLVVDNNFGASPPQAEVRLLVWDGMYGSLMESDANMFYTAVQYSGNL